jgi:hypothetical protein
MGGGLGVMGAPLDRRGRRASERAPAPEKKNTRRHQHRGRARHPPSTPLHRRPKDTSTANRKAPNDAPERALLETKEAPGARESGTSQPPLSNASPFRHSVRSPEAHRPSSNAPRLPGTAASRPNPLGLQPADRRARHSFPRPAKSAARRAPRGADERASSKLARRRRRRRRSSCVAPLLRGALSLAGLRGRARHRAAARRVGRC